MAVFYHFHHVRFYENSLVDLGWRHPTLPVVRHLYAPYIAGLKEAEIRIRSVSPQYDIKPGPFTLIRTGGLRNKLKYVYKKYFRFNVFNTEKLLAEYGKLK